MNINSRGGFGVQADIGMRGSTFSQVLILLDNVRMNDPLTAHFNSNIPIAKSEIGIIEVIKGPSSASYGSDAVGGVIHIKSKSYLQKSNEKQIDFNGEVGIGQNQFENADVGFTISDNKWIY